MERQWPDATQYPRAPSGMHRPEQAPARLLAMPFGEPGRRVDPLLVAAFALMPRLIHPTTAMSISNE